MQASYFGFIAAAYAMAAFALGGLGLWTFLDARRVARGLKQFEGGGRFEGEGRGAGR